MIQNSIKIYARLKQDSSTPSNANFYQLRKFKQEKDLITFKAKSEDLSTNKTQNYKFRFHRIFDQDSTQNELFDNVAKPVITRVLDGYNGTIFAYGQTGSGKTYAITGSSTNYDERGIIPRSIEEIFDLIQQSTGNYSIAISYLEIYNEVGYDLLNPRQHASNLVELPKIRLLADGKGECHLHNLSIRRVTTKHEAMQLLYLGDTRRTMAETPMNVYSSRSHCIFTISVMCKISSKIKKSKLNLVDLAGSERIRKTNISGTTLNEAKHINLSLHYLEQVVTALSQNRSYIPFRNSMLTYLLRDSLSRNCLTVLIATLTVNSKNIEENIATCRFAQRVADVSIEAISNTDNNPELEIECLKGEIAELKNQLNKQTTSKDLETISNEEKDDWELSLNYFISGDEEELFLNNYDLSQFQYCFKRLKKELQEHEKEKLQLAQTASCYSNEIENYKTIILERDKEIQTLKETVQNESFLSKASIQSCPSEGHKENVRPAKKTCPVPQNQNDALGASLKNSKVSANLDFYKQCVDDIHKIASSLNLVVDQCKKDIIQTKAKLVKSESEALRNQLVNQQTIYRNSLHKLESLKIESNHFKSKWEKAKNEVMRECSNCHGDVNEFVSSSHLNFNSSRMTYLRNSIADGVRKVNLDSMSLADNFSSMEGCNLYGRANSNVLHLEPERPYSNQSKRRPPLSENAILKNIIAADLASNDYSAEKKTILDEIAQKIKFIAQNGKDGGEVGTQTLRNEQKSENILDNIQSSTKTIYFASPDCASLASCSNPFIDSKASSNAFNTSQDVLRLQRLKENFNSVEMNGTEAKLDQTQVSPSYKFNESCFSEQLFQNFQKKLINPQPNSENANLCNFDNSRLESTFNVKAYNEDSDTDSFTTALGSKASNYQCDVELHKDTEEVEKFSKNTKISEDLFRVNDSDEFREYVGKLPLTGDFEVDDELVRFYRAKFK